MRLGRWLCGSSACLTSMHTWHDPQNTHKRLGMVIGVCWGGRDRQSPMGCWPVRLDYLVSSRPMRDTGSKNRHGVGGWSLRNGTEDVLTTFTRCVCEHMLTHACVYIHTNIYIPYIYTKKKYHTLVPKLTWGYYLIPLCFEVWNVSQVTKIKVSASYTPSGDPRGTIYFLTILSAQPELPGYILCSYFL